jgi:predicted ATPase
MTHLRSISLRGIPTESANRFPFTVPIVRQLEPIELVAPVTFLVGENGSGKSTLLEGIAAAAGLPTVGTESVDRDETLVAQRSSSRGRGERSAASFCVPKISSASPNLCRSCARKCSRVCVESTRSTKAVRSM